MICTEEIKKVRKKHDFSFHNELIEIAYTWVINNTSCGCAFKNLKTYASNGEIPDVIGFGSNCHSVVIECKVSISDFCQDISKPFRVNSENGMGTQRFYLCPNGLIKKEELPKGWGLIYVWKGTKARVIYSPYTGNISERSKGFKKNIKAEHELMYSVLRRFHLRKMIDEIYKPL